MQRFERQGCEVLARRRVYGGAETRSGSEAVAQGVAFQLESLILAQIERWRQA